MNRRLSLTAIGHATSLLFSISFVLCVGFDFIFPEQAMYQSWQNFLPGFEWISWKSFLLGIIESYAYGWYVALIWTPLYNFFISRSTKGEDE
ncbi:MAG: hypothetical protein GXP13_01265 [Gammaproteobacteria bacterium]|nr:hypothetical protein [Gammaproteobacteria bacterium]